MIGDAHTVVDTLLNRSATVVAPLAAAVIFFIRFLRSDRTYHNTSAHLEDQVERLRKRVEHLEDVEEVRDKRESAMRRHMLNMELDLSRVGLDVPATPDWDKEFPIPKFGESP